MLDEGFRHRAVDVVVRHLVADTVCAPPEREFGQVAGAEDDGAVVVRQPEQMRRAFTGLHVLEGDVVDLLAAGVGVVEVGEHLLARRPDVDLLAGHTE